jgi:DNA primase
LHARTGTLHRELKAAEAALADEPSDANLARLNDIRAELAKSEGTEALIEGFGASSGRQARLY